MSSATFSATDNKANFINDIGRFLSSCTLTSKQKRLAQVCFTFLCSIVGDDIGVESDHDRNPSLWDQAAVKLIDAITSVPTKTYERDNFFAYLPEQKWPSFFQTYVDSISESSQLKISGINTAN